MGPFGDNRRLHRLRRVAATLAAATLCSGSAFAQIPRDTIEIGVEDAAAPWSQPDGTGYANDLARAAFAASGIATRLHVLPYARCKSLVVSGALAACVSMSPAPELRDVVRFSAHPMFVFACDFFENPRHPIGRTIDELPLRSVVGTVLGYEYPPEILARLAARQAILEPASTEETNLRKLAAGRIAAALVNRDEIKSAEWVAARAGVLGRVRSVYRMGALPGYVGFSVVHPRGLELARRFDDGMKRIIANGEHERIKRRWIALNHASALGQ
jgi:ABC-type amino acid transport substrate-binding protein